MDHKKSMDKNGENQSFKFYFKENTHRNIDSLRMFYQIINHIHNVHENVFK